MVASFSSKDEDVVLGKLLHKSVARRTEIFTPNFCCTNTTAHFHLLCSLKQINGKHSQCLDTLLLFTTVVYLASFTTRNFSSHSPMAVCTLTINTHTFNSRMKTSSSMPFAIIFLNCHNFIKHNFNFIRFI